METTVLEKRINERAQKRFDAEYKVFCDFMKTNRIAKSLKIKDMSIEDDEDGPFILLFQFGQNNALFNEEQKNNRHKEKTNFEKVKEALVDSFIKEETDDLLQKISLLKDFWNEHQ